MHSAAFVCTGDGQSSSSSTAHTKDRSLTEGSSLDLEWDHEAGQYFTVDNLVACASCVTISPPSSV